MIRIKLFYDSFQQSLAFIDEEGVLYYWNHFYESFMPSYIGADRYPTVKGDSRFEFLGYL